MIYLNHAATSFPKPPEVVEAVVAALRGGDGDPRRGGSGRDPLATARERLAALLGAAGPRQVVLLPSATHALNLVLDGLLPSGHAVATELEHSSVLRPLAHLGLRRGVEATLVRPDREGRVDPAAVEAAIVPATRVVAVTHASNATGAVQDIEAIAEVAASRGVPLLVDAAQTAGALPLCHRTLPGRVFVAFSGHKALLGPAGTGGLVVPDERLEQTLVGGTGVQSESVLHPGSVPLRHEAGTPNVSGLAGLAAGTALVLARGVEAEAERRDRLVARLRVQLEVVPGLALSPLPGADGRAGIVAFTLEGWSPEDLGAALRDAFGIEVRAGLHCAPRAHEALGTAPLGTVRASVGRETAAADVDALAEALGALTAVSAVATPVRGAA